MFFALSNAAEWLYFCCTWSINHLLIITCALSFIIVLVLSVKIIFYSVVVILVTYNGLNKFWNQLNFGLEYLLKRITTVSRPTLLFNWSPFPLNMAAVSVIYKEKSLIRSLNIFMFSIFVVLVKQIIEREERKKDLNKLQKLMRQGRQWRDQKKERVWSLSVQSHSDDWKIDMWELFKIKKSRVINKILNDKKL